MQRGLVFSSLFALAFGGAAWAQTQMPAPGANPTMGGSSAGVSAPAKPSMAPMPSGGMNSGTSATRMSGAQQSPSPDQVKEAQTELKQQGLYHGAIDGVVGKGTKAAVAQFQKSHGLPQTAGLDQRTLDQLTHGGTSGSSIPSSSGASGAAAGSLSAHPTGGAGTGATTQGK